MSVIYSDSASAKINALIKLKSTTAQLWNQVAAGDFKKIAEMGRALQYQNDMLLELIAAVVATGDRVQVTDGTGKPVAIIGQLDGDKFGIHATDAYFGGTLGDTSTAEVTVENGSATFTGTVTAAAFDVWIPLIDELVLTDNSPAAGRVAWDAFNLYFAGTTYAIASGNTSSSTHKHIYWVRGASTLTTAVEMPQDIDNYLIAANISGVGEIVIGKPGAGKSITEDALVPSLLKGMAGQPPATASINLASGGTNTTIINDTSGGGVITAVYVVVTTAVTGTPTAVLKIQIDGETEQSYPLYTAANTASENWNAISDGRSGDMSGLGDYRFMSSSIQFPYASSATVKFHVTTAGAGNVGVYVTRGIKTNM